MIFDEDGLKTISPPEKDKAPRVSVQACLWIRVGDLEVNAACLFSLSETGDLQRVGGFRLGRVLPCGLPQIVPPNCAQQTRQDHIRENILELRKTLHRFAYQHKTVKKLEQHMIDILNLGLFNEDHVFFS